LRRSIAARGLLVPGRRRLVIARWLLIGRCRLGCLIAHPGWLRGRLISRRLVTARCRLLIATRRLWIARLRGWLVRTRLCRLGIRGRWLLICPRRLRLLVGRRWCVSRLLL